MNPVLLQILQALQQRTGNYQAGGNKLNSNPGSYLDNLINPQQTDQMMQYNPQDYVGHQLWMNMRPQDFKTNT